MINILHKIYPTNKQKSYLADCLWSSIGVENWVIGQIRNNVNEAYFPLRFMKPIALRSHLSRQIKGHSVKSGLPSKLLNDCISSVLIGFKKHGIAKLRWKSVRKKKSFCFNGDIKFDKKFRLKLPGLKTTIKISETGKFAGKLKKVTLINKFDGWYASCCYDQNRQRIAVTDKKEAGIDPGLKSSLVLSDTTVINFPRFYQESEGLLKKTQRKSKNSKNIKYLARKIANRRKDHHHKLSTNLAKEYAKIYWSNDNFKNLMKKFGKAYSNLALGSFRDLLKTKLASRIDGQGELVEVACKNSTKTCSACGSLTGPTGWDGLEVRNWQCGRCGTAHDRDINAAINALISGRGATSNKWNHVNRTDSCCESNNA